MAKPATKKAGLPSVPKKKPQNSAASHPSYFQMVQEAILALHERGGSSPYAIAKYMQKKHKGSLPDNFRKLLAVQLRNLTAKGKLVKVKASFKLSPSEKQVTKKPEKVEKPKAAKKSVTAPVSVLGKRKTEAGSKKVGAPANKKVKRAAPVKPKTIKSPAAKKVRKAAA